MLLINLAISFLSVLKAKSLDCMSTINQKCMTRPKTININDDEPIFYPYNIKINKCSGSCNNINDPFEKLCVPDVIKNINVKVFNLMVRINETRQMIVHESCKYICRLTSAICNTKQVWNKDKCQCECREDLINKLVCDRGYMWNPGSCECECDKLCGVGQHLDFRNCVCRKSLVNILIEECIKVVDGDAVYNDSLVVPVDSCSSQTPYIAMFVVFLLISGVVGGVFVYWYRYKRVNVKKDFLDVNYSNVGKISY